MGVQLCELSFYHFQLLRKLREQTGGRQDQHLIIYTLSSFLKASSIISFAQPATL
jgi:hypothetical protein